MEKQTNANQSVEKSIRIIEVLAHSNEPMRLLDIASITGMPTSTALRMLAALQECGYVYQEDELKRYALTLRLMHIGQMAAENFSLRDSIHPYLHKVSQDSGESVCAAVKSENVIRYIDVIESRIGMIRIRQTIGGTAKMHCTGSGKLFLMNYSESSLDRFIQQTGLSRFTEKTITGKNELINELAKCKKNGYALDNEEYELGVRCVAVPINDNKGEPLAVISISGPISRMTENRINNELLPLLFNASHSIEHKLGTI